MLFRSDPDSTLSFTRDLIALRRASPDLRLGAYEELPAPNDVWAWRRGEGTVVAVNLGRKAAELDVRGRPLLTTGGEFDRTLRPASGVVLSIS